MTFDFAINTTSVMNEVNKLDLDYKLEVRLEQFLDMLYIISKYNPEKVSAKIEITKFLYLPFYNHKAEKYYQSIIIKSIKGKQNERSN